MLGLLRGVAASLLLTANLIAGTTCAFVFILLAKVLPSPLSAGCMWLVRVLVWMHAYGIRLVLRYVSGVRWTMDCPDDGFSSSRYVMMVNHRSQMDILCLMAACVDRLPPMKFFLKRSLMYVPFMGQFCYLMGYPFIDRFTRAKLVDPTIRKRRAASIYAQCQALFQQDVCLAIFVEGTRFCARRAQKSRYKHLLPPQSIGLANALSSCKEVLQCLDVTLLYSGQQVSSWQVLSGQLSHVHMVITKVPCPAVDIHDAQSLKSFHRWLQALWLDKDDLIQKWRSSKKE
ncbi:MAG: acetyltransferase [Pseudomonadota bacterium]|nr:acetyltransferase [Pseudomonadota bacterium]